MRYSKKAILSWCLYDWGVAAFPVIVTTFIFSTYFISEIAQNKIVGTQQWGNAMALSGIVASILAPMLGAIADRGGKRKYWLAGFIALMWISTALLWLVHPTKNAQYFMLLSVILGTVGINIAAIFYNALLPGITSPKYIGRISGWGWGLGYLGGLAILLIAYYGFVIKPHSWLNTQSYEQIRICGPLVTIWSALFAIPLFLFVPDKQPSQSSLFRAVKYGLRDLMVTLKWLKNQRKILLFLIAQMFYLDGLNTLFAFGGIYAAGTFQLSISEVFLFGIAINACAGVGSIILAWVDDWIGPKPTILFSLFCLILFGLGIVLVENKTLFWILGCLLSCFVGSVQSSSRSFMTQIIPADKTTSLFGFNVLSSKVTTFLGPWILGLTTLFFNSQRVGMATILLFFILGAAILLKVDYSNET